MKFINKKIVNGLAALLAVAAFTLAGASIARADNDVQPPALPPVCSGIAAPYGNKPFLRVYAVGVQIYKWNGNVWELVAPLANLYADRDFREPLGFHYGGPTWEIENSKVIAARRAGCTPDATAIPWLLLQTTFVHGRGKLRRTTYIQRVNTAGGLAPTAPGASVGVEVRVPYTTEYYFYRVDNGFGDLDIGVDF